MALSSTCHIFRSHRRNARDARTDLEVFIYTYAAEAKLGTMDEAGIAVHRRDRKAMVHHLVHPNRKRPPAP
jgi:hypothetical protein